jgi:tetratricopeptide (TPR) repeat protein
MHMRGKRSVSLVVVGAVVICSVSFALSAAPLQPTVDSAHMSAALAGTIEIAKGALKAAKYVDAIAKLKAAEANPQKTAYDEHIINELATVAYVRTNNYLDAAKALEAQLNDGLLEQAEVPEHIKAAAQINYHIKNYDKAIQYGTDAIAGGFADDEIYTLVAQAYYLNAQYDSVRDFLGKRIESLRTQARDVPRSYFQLALSSCIKLHDSACATAYSKRLGGPRDPILIDPIFTRGAILNANAGSR